MAGAFLAGVHFAWALAQVALAVYFALVHLVRRRGVEYVLFGLLCFAFACVTGGVGLTFVAGTEVQWLRATDAALAACCVAVAVNFHFVLVFGALPGRLVPSLSGYGLAVTFLVLMVSGAWWVPGSFTFHQGVVLGASVPHGELQGAGPPQLLVSLFVIVQIVSVVVFARAVTQGRHDAVPPLIAGLLLPIASVNDWLLVSGSVHATVFLVPTASFIYSLAIASSFAIRYGATIAELETTTDALEAQQRRLMAVEEKRREIEQALDEKEQLAVVGELAAAIAHEVRNPLAVVMNAVASLRRSDLDEQDRQMLLSIVEEEVGRLNRLVTDLLRFAKPVNLAVAPVTLEELVEQARYRMADTHALEVDVPEAEALVPLAADASLLRVGLENLLENACQAMPDGGTVRIRARNESRDDGPWVRVEVIDSGRGMPDDVRERATRPFFTTRPAGTGLGLPIVARIVRAHGGSLEIDSQPDRGTTVALVLRAVGHVDDDVTGPGLPAGRPEFQRDSATG